MWGVPGVFDPKLNPRMPSFVASAESSNEYEIVQLMLGSTIFLGHRGGSSMRSLLGPQIFGTYFPAFNSGWLLGCLATRFSAMWLHAEYWVTQIRECKLADGIRE